MFAVPGWKTLDTARPKTQTEAHVRLAAAATNGDGNSGASGQKRKRKRKRGDGEESGTVQQRGSGTGANRVAVAVGANGIGRGGGIADGSGHGSVAGVAGPGVVADRGRREEEERTKKKKKTTSDGPKEKQGSSKKTLKRAKQRAGAAATVDAHEGVATKHDTERDPHTTNGDAPATATTRPSANADARPATAAREPAHNGRSQQQQLTPLQQKMRDKLTSARFRHLNETLYTSPSGASQALFASNRDMYADYHAGFRRQVISWPENPVETLWDVLRARASVRPHANPSKAVAAGTEDMEALPRARGRGEGWCTVADLGCGDAVLGQRVRDNAFGDRRKVKVLSYDLVAENEHVQEADIRSLPLADGSVDVAVFCLALMGTNWVEFVEEAYRVLRWKGELWVAEIKSRFVRKGGEKGSGKAVVAHSVGKRRKVVGGKASRAGAEDGARDGGGVDQDDTDIIRTEVDGIERKEETDVGAFVEVLRRRGFVLKDGQRSVDLENKMFVRMEFVKAAPATKGKCMRDDQRPPPASGPGVKKFIDTTDEVSVEEEAATLKPCLYKVR